MKVIVVCEDNSTFEFSSVLIYPYYNALADERERYQIRISHGTVFSNSKQDYVIFKCGSEYLRNLVHKKLNMVVSGSVRNCITMDFIWIVLKPIIEDAISEEANNAQ